MSDPRFSGVHVSALYRAGTAWAVTLCSDCYAESSGESGREREPSTLEVV
jgi:hypothetical protein